MTDDTALIPAGYEDLLNGPNIAVLATSMPDGTLQNLPLWYWYDGSEVTISIAKSRQKYRNLARSPHATLTLLDPANPMRYLEIRASVELEDDPTAALRDRIAVKHGLPDGSAFDPPGAERVIVHLHPVHVNNQ